ncbi:N-acetylmuramoyl-L-alanine amidase [Caldibacillus thermolactis]|jgi:N-acetylmuramoyl-L-alanine amidase|uniref:N-acetylmuramoyl-L-alanine amidase n=1 Tax=Pallidibacillus thermolactis TaxID=251051 RepID=A0ABT2WG33_9BACI|nr:N-acetylmuramoyl-L-alanine amidase [Pallidibacillus thermolactis]MCU9594648.1 N-acetylmuramoyl-L-alanine amidase [Pallidibacillus thermolactis]
MVRIFIDPGHGGTDPGAVANGLKEKDLTLKIAKYARDFLLNNYSGVQVKMSRTSDTTKSLSARTKEANNWNADAYVSIHINAGGGTGFESYVYPGVGSSTKNLQNDVHGEVMKVFSGFRDRGKKQENYHVLRESKMKAVLTENGFIDTKKDAEFLKSESNLKKIGEAHAVGIAKHFNLKKKSSSPSKPKENTSTGTYTVKPGDTLWGISQKYGVTIEQIKEANGLTSDTIYVGQKLIIPIGGCDVREFKVGDKVKIKSSATHYATGQTIPNWVKGQTYTIQQVKSDRVLLKEIISWVYKKDLE